MAHQINLCNPILLAPRRHFSALAMGQALAVFVLGLAALCAWAALRTASLHGDLRSADQAYRIEHKRMADAVARLPAPGDTATLERELALARVELARREQWLEQARGGAAATAPAPSGWLRLLARATPEPIWLTEVRVSDAKVELSGMSLRPEALRPWLTALAADPVARGLPFGRLRVERAESAAGEAWSFQAVSGVEAPNAARIP